MSVLDGDRQLYVHYVDGPQQVSVIGEPGKHGPSTPRAMGKVLVAFAPPDVREHLLETVELPARTEHDHRPGRPGARRSPACSATGTPSRTRSTRRASAPLACPCRRVGDRDRGASVAAPAFRASMEHLVGFVPQLTAAAHELALRLPTGRALGGGGGSRGRGTALVERHPRAEHAGQVALVGEPAPQRDVRQRHPGPRQQFRPRHAPVEHEPVWARPCRAPTGRRTRTGSTPRQRRGRPA